MLHSICQQIWKTQQWPQDWKWSVFILIPTKGNVKECSNYHTIVLISHPNKVMLKILQARLQQCVNCELPDVQAGFRKGRGTRNQIANIHWIIGKAREFQKNIYFCFIDYAKAFDCVHYNKLWKILKEIVQQPHLQGLWFAFTGKKQTLRSQEGMECTQLPLARCFQMPPPGGALVRWEYHTTLPSSWEICMQEKKQSTSWKTLGWMKHKLESRLQGEISITSDMQVTPPLWQKVKKNKESLDESERGEWKSWLKAQHSEN